MNDEEMILPLLGTAEIPTDTLQTGTELELTIEDLAFGGEGVGRHAGFVIFVPYVIPGERVRVRLGEIKKRYARAALIEVLKPSIERATPLCPYFMSCGGCQYQHVNYPAQLTFKHKQIVDLFQRLAGISAAAIDPVVPCPTPYHYRNRIMVRSQWNKLIQKLVIGFMQVNSRLVVDIEECKISEPAVNEALTRLRANPPPRGGLKKVLRVLPAGWDVPGESFFQNNFHLLPALIETARARVKESEVSYLVDLYCGVGLFSVELGSSVKNFIGVEVDRLAVEAARRNAAKRGLTNGEYLLGDAAAVLPSIISRFPPEESVFVIDPPRTGCPPDSLAQLREVHPKQILYVSCHPSTLARDIAILCKEQRYELRKITPFDMFPQTQHVECIADLRRP